MAAASGKLVVRAWRSPPTKSDGISFARTPPGYGPPASLGAGSRERFERNSDCQGLSPRRARFDGCQTALPGPGTATIENDASRELVCLLLREAQKRAQAIEQCRASDTGVIRQNGPVAGRHREQAGAQAQQRKVRGAGGVRHEAPERTFRNEITRIGDQQRQLRLASRCRVTDVRGFELREIVNDVGVADPGAHLDHQDRDRDPGSPMHRSGLSLCHHPWLSNGRQRRPVERQSRHHPAQSAEAQARQAFRRGPVDDMAEFWTALQSQEGTAAQALRFLILTAARSGEVRGARWEEVDTRAKLWTVPAARMKARREHLVPLGPAALALLTLVVGQLPVGWQVGV